MSSFQIRCDTEEGSLDVDANQSQFSTNYYSRVDSEQRKGNPCSNESQIFDDTTTRKEQQMRLEKERRRAQSSKNLTSLSGMGKEFVNLLKKSAHDQDVFYGKRKPLGDVSAGRKNLQAKAASKKELEKIHSKLSDFC